MPRWGVLGPSQGHAKPTYSRICIQPRREKDFLKRDSWFCRIEAMVPRDRGIIPGCRGASCRLRSMPAPIPGITERLLSSAPSLRTLTSAELILVDLGQPDRDTLLKIIAERIAEVRDLAPMPILQGLLDREKLGSTAVGGGVALPHTRSDQVQSSTVVIAVFPDGMDYGGQPVRAVFAVVSPAKDASQNLQCLAAISRWVQQDGAIDQLVSMPTPAAVLELIQDHGPAPPG